MRVRQRGMGSGGDDGFEGRLLGAQHFHLKFNLGGDVELTYAGPNALEHAGEGFRVQVDAATDGVDLGGRLQHAALFNDAAHRHQRDAERKAFLQALVGIELGPAAFEADFFQALSLDDLDDPGDQGAFDDVHVTGNVLPGADL